MAENASDKPTQAYIHSYRLTVTHDGEGAAVFNVQFNNQGRSQVLVSNAQLVDIMQRAGVDTIQEMVGMDWQVLRYTSVNR